MEKKDPTQETPAKAEEHETPSQSGITRREFLDTTLAATPVLAFPGLIGSACQSAEATTLATPASAASRVALAAQAPLTQPKIIRSTDGTNVNSSLVMKMKEWVDDGTTLKLKDADTPDEATILNLRTYGSPIDPNRPINPDTDENLEYTIPGPTFVVEQGQNLNIDLYNRMGVAGVPDTVCTPNYPKDPDQYPDCFHGENTTNIHYHGSHVSPNEPQDWVFLQLRPKGASPEPSNPDVRVGDYKSRVGPFPKTQAVGTHWYHPHKHGSTALQVINGMAGTFLVEGYFDAFLKEQLPGLEQKVLVIQQIQEHLTFPNPRPGGPAKPRINGTLNPVIEMRPGEIQWWRFVGATQEATANIVIQFEGQPGEVPDMRQIAQDGVPYAPENYQRQTFNLAQAAFSLLGDRRSLLASVAQGAQQQFQVAPGNRVDFLIQAPEEPGDYRMLNFLVEKLAPEVLLEFLQAGTAPLLTVRVTGNPKRMTFPTTLPPLPPQFSDITGREVGNRKKTVLFSMDKGPGSPPPPKFFIDGKQYDPDRIDHLVVLNRAEEWSVENSSTVAHPFHIHINPFQIIAIDGQPLPQPWVWYDTIALPTGTTSAPGSVTIRQRFLEFTGKYVLHCHILGHEDRGMMQNVLAEDPRTFTSGGGNGNR